MREQEAAVSRITILDPTAPPPPTDLDPGPSAGALGGQRVGIRNDRAWRSFDWVADEWAQRFGRAGADVRSWTAGNRIGEEGVRVDRELHAFVADVTLAVVGLGN